MANAFIEPTSDGKYQIEIPGEKNVGPFDTQKEAIDQAKKLGHKPLVARVRHLNDKKVPDHWRSAD